MAHDRDDSTDDDKGDGLADFEAMLRERDKQWTKPPQEMKPTDQIAATNLDEHFEIKPVADVVEDSNQEPKSTETVESIPAEPSESAKSVESDGEEEFDDDAVMLERGTEIKLHNHPITGPWIVEESVAWRYDPKSMDIFNNQMSRAIGDMPMEEIIERISKMERAVKYIRIAEQGLRSGMAQRLSKMRDVDRQKYEEMSRKSSSKNQTQTKIARSRKSSTGASPKPKAEAKTKTMNWIDTLKKNGEDREGVIEMLKLTNRLDAAALAYIEKLTW